MSAPAFKVGDMVQPVEWGDRKYREPVRIVGETATLWITDGGERWRKSDGALTPRYIDLRRRIVPAKGGAQ